MHRIILAVSIGLLSFVVVYLLWKPNTGIVQGKGMDYTKNVALKDKKQPLPAKPAAKPKVYNQEPILVWASDHVKYWACDDAQINPQKWDADWTLKFNEIRQFTDFQTPFQLEIFAYPTVERKAIRTHSMRAAHTDNGKVHLVSNEFFKGETWGEQYRPILQAALGDSKHEALELGLAMQWCDKIRGEEISHWVALLAQAGALPSLSDLYSKDVFDSTPLFATKLAAAAWVEYCLAHKGKGWFLEHYVSATPSMSTLEQWNKEWKQWIIGHAPLAITSIPVSNKNRLNGFTLAHEGYRIYNGYGGDLARQSIEHLAAIGTNAVAIVPYSYMRSPHKATRIPVVNGPGMENDESVLFSHYSAKKQGQFTLLKPQIWIQGSWPGDVDFKNDQEWEQFFKFYRNWILHYALLAEMNHFDGFCIGTELRHATLKHPAYWRALIKDVRKIYHGYISYAANWGEECEKISFWEEVDFIGINCYYPLHKQNNASEAELRQGAKKNLAKIKNIYDQYQRPVWFTEVGFRSAQWPWKSPHAEAGVRLIDDEAQALCYEVLLSELEKNEWITGLFWWKWPTDLSYNEDHGRGYMPLGKETEEVVKRYYMKE